MPPKDALFAQKVLQRLKGSSQEETFNWQIATSFALLAIFLAALSGGALGQWQKTADQQMMVAYYLEKINPQ